MTARFASALMSERKVVFTGYGWETYSSWPTRDRTVSRAANKQIAVALIDPFKGASPSRSGITCPADGRAGSRANIDWCIRWPRPKS